MILLRIRSIIIIFSFLFIIKTSFSQSDKWSDVSDVFQRSGTLKDNVYKISFPRFDLNVTIDGKKIAPGLALGGWVAFMEMDNMGAMGSFMVMGDLVLLESELPDVQKSLLANGIKITGIHNHLLNESPKVMYMHIHGTGDKIKLANSIKDALQKSATVLDTNQFPKTSASEPDWSSVEKILGYTGMKKGNVLNLGIPRNDDIVESGTTIPPFMGFANSVNFQMVDNSAFTTGDFVLHDDEVANVMDALVSGGITVTAVHNHMINENPRIFFMHFWGYDSPDVLAKVIKTALEKTNYKKNQ